ncbi:MAG: ABC transporter substrate-binding protein [Candidatus Riflebacteria bacterium]|nr:ABC transporter substrate-binding protein [Candidatus Riflebacteria bacterium]
MRIVSLLPSQTELLCELGFKKNLVGISNYCNFPPDIASLPKVGAQELDLERIVSLKPNFIVDLNHGHEKYKPSFDKLGMIYLDYPLLKFDEIPIVAASLSADLGCPESGKRFALDWVEKLRSATVTKEKVKRIYVEVWDSPIQAAGGGSFINDLIARAGGKNIFCNVTIPFPLVSAEAIIAGDPEIIILTYSSPNPLSIGSRIGWDGLSAVKTKSIISVEPDIFERPGPRCIEAIKRLSEIFDSFKQ